MGRPPVYDRSSLRLTEAERAAAVADGKPLSEADLKGKPALVNVWATWCVACRQEHPLLVDFAQRHQVPIVGMSYKEIQPQDAAYKAPFDEKLKLARERSQVWLKRHGNPYMTTVMDLDGRVGINYGVYGVPETYVIDKAGVIRYKHIGDVNAVVWEKTLKPIVDSLQ